MNDVISSSLYERASALYEYVWEYRDKRLDDWFLMNSPLPTLLLTGIYVLVALKLGPSLMKNRQPFNVRKFIVLHNLVMIVYNGYIVHQMWVLAWGNDYSWRCQPLDRSTSPRSLKIARTVWLFYICKFLDWFDTLFFILRKKFSHVSGLHVYHHSVMPCFVWSGTRIMPGGHITFGIPLNGSVHVIMHTYYCLSAMGPQFHKYLWWKKYITTLQLIQFVVGIIHAIQALFVDCGIDIPFEFAYPFSPQPFLFFYLFYKFYRENYTKPPSFASSVAEIDGAKSKRL